jgi:[ribosomal protein S5]-alanine N-acetyltransferase
MQEKQLLSEIPTLHTKRFTLRSLTIEDTRALFSILSNKKTMKFITSNPVKSEEEVQKVIAKYLTRFLEQKELPWVIIETGSQRIIGQFRLHKLDLWHKKAEMGAVIHEDYQRKGVMTEILTIMIPFVFETLKLNRLVGDIFAGNEGSRKLLEKFGFKKEGVLRQTDFDGKNYHDTVVYSMLAEDYHDSGTKTVT